MNLDAYADLVPGDLRGRARVILITVTAPGADVLPWDQGHCAALGPHKHSGTLGCRVRPVAASAWNASAPARWRSLHRAAYIRARRLGLRPSMLVRVWEVQHRGALHVHPVMGFTTASEVKAARGYLRLLTELAPAHGFGFVDRKLDVMPAARAAGYLSSYFATGKGGKMTLQQSVEHPQMPRSIIHVSRTLTMATGCTIRRLRMHRFAYVRLGRSPMCEGDTWHVLDRYAVGSTGKLTRRQEQPCAAP